MADRDLIERHVERIMVKPHAIQVRLVASNNELAQAGGKDSLSSIARAITGTTWNGPRFFGLRDAKTKTSEVRDGS